MPLSSPAELSQPELAAVPTGASLASAGRLKAHCAEGGTAWYDLPGVDVVRGVRAYVQPQEPAEPSTDDDTETQGPNEEPAGERLYLESWTDLARQAPRRSVDQRRPDVAVARRVLQVLTGPRHEREPAGAGERAPHDPLAGLGIST